MLYRIYTENTGCQVAKIIKRVLGKYRLDATVQAGFGIYKGREEPSAVIEIVSNCNLSTYKLEEKIFAAAEEIRKLNKQESVLVVKIPGEVTFLTAGAINGTKTEAEYMDANNRAKYY